MSTFKFALGQEAQDLITGMSGILIARCEHITGCDTYGISPKTAEAGKRPDTEFFDEGRIKIIGEGVRPEMFKTDKPGCDTRKDNPK